VVISCFLKPKLAVTVITHYAQTAYGNPQPLSLVFYCNDGWHGIKTPFFAGFLSIAPCIIQLPVPFLLKCLTGRKKKQSFRITFLPNKFNCRMSHAHGIKHYFNPLKYDAFKTV